MKLKYTVILSFILIVNLFSQQGTQITVTANGKTEKIQCLVKNNISFLAASDYAKLFNASIYTNSDAGKVEIKFQDGKLKITGKNQFVVFTPASAKEKVFQLPVSALLINDEIYVSALYTAKIFSQASKREVIFDEAGKRMQIKGNAPSKTEFQQQQQIQPQSQPINVTEEPKNTNSKYDITAIQVEEKSNGTLIRLVSSHKLTLPRNSVYENKLFLFLNNLSIAPGIVQKVKEAGLVKSAAFRHVSAKNDQLEFELGEGFSSYEVSYDYDTEDILIAVHNKLFNTSAKNNLNDLKSKWALDAIVLDAGHGGKDAGAIGVKGTKEKEINLAIALKVGALIKKELPQIKVVFTRSNDTFVELYKRGKIANENGGKLFVSIHCNSMPKKPSESRGFEAYLLRLGKTQDAIEIAEFENSVIKYEENPERYKKLTDENFIFVSMAHSAFMRFSESFSDILNETWQKKTELPSRGIKQAGFYVLVGASMPSILIESGFLSNTQDEKYLKSVKGQNDIARAIVESIKQYKTLYEKSLSDKK